MMTNFQTRFSRNGRNVTYSTLELSASNNTIILCLLLVGNLMMPYTSHDILLLLQIWWKSDDRPPTCGSWQFVIIQYGIRPPSCVLHFRDLTYFLFTKFGAEILFHGRISPKYGQKMKSNTAPAAVLNLLPVVISVTWYLWFSAAAHKICCNRTVFGKKRYILIFRYGVYPPSWIFNEVKFYYLDISRIQFHMRVQNSMQRYKISFSTEWQKKQDPLWRQLPPIYFRWRFTAACQIWHQSDHSSLF